MTNDEYTTITIEKDNDAETNKKVKSMGSESGDNSDVEVVTIEGEKSMESESGDDTEEENDNEINKEEARPNEALRAIFKAATETIIA
ncbi:20861_t:CDS:1, partial [Entrophospora sp. SA101]